MNKSQNPHVAGYLNNASLFKSNQKNRFVSAYRNHQGQEKHQTGTVRNGLRHHSLVVVKEEERFSSFGGQLQPGEDRADAIKATVKREPSVQNPPLQSAILLENLFLKQEQATLKEKQDPLRQSSSKVIKSILASQSSVKQSGAKIVVKYSNNPSEKMRENVIQAIEQSQPRKKSRHSSYLNIKDDVLYDGNADNVEQEQNPYLPSSAKKQPEETQVKFKKVDSKSFNPSEAPREELFMTNSSISRRREQPSEQQSILRREDHLTTVRREVGGYLCTVKQKLSMSYASLENMQCQFQAYVEKAVQLQCERVKGSLLRVVEQGVRDLREFQRRQLNKHKLLFMADLYQIKCNIDLRLGEIQEYSSRLRSQKWKNAVGSIVALDYNQNIEFVLGKAQEIQQDLLANTAPALKDYLAGVNQQLTQEIRMAIADSFQASLHKFDSLRTQGRLFPKGQSHPPPPSPVPQ